MPALILVWALLSLVSCQSKEKKMAEQVDAAATRLAHLANYRELECVVKVSFSEPARSAWLNRLSEKGAVSGSGTQVFLKVEETAFHWRATPYRCRLGGPRSDSALTDLKEILTDTEKKLEMALCTWVQSFYADSPLRGWRKGEGELEEVDGGTRIKKGEARGLEIRDGGKKIVARLGEGGELSGFYKDIGGKLYPYKVSFQRGENLGSLEEWNYLTQNRREIPTDFWINFNQGTGQASAYMRADVSDCNWR